MALWGSRLVVTHARGGGAVKAQAVPAGGTPQSPPVVKTGDIDFNNILALVPAEAVAPFLSAKSAVPPTLTSYVWVWICFGVCMVICLALRIKATQPEGARGLGGVNWVLVFASAVAFFIWAQATTDDGLMVPIFHGSFAGLVALAYGIIVPRFVPAVPRS